MLTVKTVHAVNADHAKGMDTQALRDNFLSEGLFSEGEIRLTYTHYDRMIMGSSAQWGLSAVGRGQGMRHAKHSGSARNGHC